MRDPFSLKKVVCTSKSFCVATCTESLGLPGRRHMLRNPHFTCRYQRCFVVKAAVDWSSSPKIQTRRKGERAEICGSGHWHANAVHGVARLSANQIRRPRPACGPLLSSSGKLRRTRWLLGRAAPRPSESHAPVVYNSSSRPGSRLGPAFLLERSDIFF